MPTVPSSRSLRRWPGLLALAVTVFGARLWLIHTYGSALPFWDQWDGEGLPLVKPWAEHRLDVALLFVGHNEHRICFTRLLALALLNGNGLWDARLEMTVNALLFSGILTLMAAAVTRGLPVTLLPVALMATVVLGTLPFGWENTLCGFQNQFYFLLGFSLLVLWGLGMHAPFCWQWWVGVIATPLAGLSMAGGVFAPAVALGMRVLRGLRGCQGGVPPRREAWGLGIPVVLVGGDWLLVAPAPHHAGLRAADLGEFLRVLGFGVGWPWYGSGWGWAALMFAPWLMLLGVYLSGDRRGTPVDAGNTRAIGWLLGLGMLTLLQTLAVAYARGRGLTGLPSRYLDQSAIGVWANALAAVWLAWRYRSDGRAGSVVATLAAVWLAQAGVGLWQQTQRDFTLSLPIKRAESRAHEERVRGFVLSGDFERYLKVDKPLDLPYPRAEALGRWLQDPSIRRFLPACVREPLALEIIAGNGVNDAFHAVGAEEATIPWFPSLPVGERAWSSYSLAQGGDAAQGELVARFPAVLRTPFLSVRHAGYVGRPGLTLELEDTRPGGGKTTLKPSEPAREAWVDVPWRATARRQLVLRASDQSPQSWLAFCAPREDGPLSYRAARLGAWGGSLFSLGLSGLVVLGVSGPLRAPAMDHQLREA